MTQLSAPQLSEQADEQDLTLTCRRRQLPLLALLPLLPPLVLLACHST